MVDIHCHILPGVDDGASTWETAIEMCRMAAEDGIEHIVATPHANYKYRYDRSRFEDIVAELSEKIRDRPKLHLGCDVHLSYENFSAILAEPAKFTIGATQYLLIELDDFSVPASVSDNFRELTAHGLTPIVTHPERNQFLQADVDRVQDWLALGCLVQVTASSLTGDWGPKAKSAAQRLLQRQWTHVLATDAHNTNLRPPVLSKARVAAQRLAGSRISSALVRENPLAIINGESIVLSERRETVS
jgi:protein-tyrosine phosphatase